MRSNDTRCAWHDTSTQFVLGELADVEREAYGDHLLKGCGACGSELYETRMSLAALDQAVAQGTVASDTESEELDRVRRSLAERLSLQATVPTSEPTSEPTSVPDEPEWIPMDFPGVDMRMLHYDDKRQRQTVLLRMAAGCTFPEHVHYGDEESFMVTGDLSTTEVSLRAGDFAVSPAGSTHLEQTTQHGCLILVTTTLVAS